ncbi:NUDIX hydrolase [Chlorobaculum sp. 24CR]|uniref:NUDIX hydrolase n=1 Tax=Chlorobaculum sp. 24CR TaxID=2508878 RepID=UPI00100C0E21|nr:NUDIX hydrolase [Chlorobaculum sp. 24CR]RXK81645.1 NUDIX hydrolase [Chlorobaculum sp. 24CR]
MSGRIDNDPERWEVLESAYLHRRPWLTVRRDKVRLTSGRTIDDYYVQEFPAWVNVLAITEAGDAVLIRQYRHGLGEVSWELPAGVLDEGESLLDGAKRELLEETGYSGGTWKPLMELSANPALQNNISYSFLAEGVSLAGSQQLDPTEEITVHLTPLERLREIVFDGGMIQALHSAPVLKYFLQRG